MAGASMHSYLGVCLLILSLEALSRVAASRLNAPRVLLPYNHETPSNFTLKVYEGGCYRWTCSREGVVALSEVMVDGCASEVHVSAISRSAARQTAIILAQDPVSAGLLRCDAVVDAMHELVIVTTTRELYVEEAPVEFIVRAYDDQGNEFSTLEGMEFIWELETITNRESVVAAHTILRFMTYEESPYKVPRAIEPLEANGMRGNMILIEGKQTGSARVTARLAHPAYKDLPPASVDLMVVANLLLDPADVYVLPHTAVQYTVSQLKQGQLYPISVKGSQYCLQVSDTEVAELNEDGITVTALSLGTTQVVLKDKNVASSELVKQPTATVHVVDPSYLTISIAPHYNPLLTRGRHYAFLVTVYDKHNNNIFLADNIVIDTKLPEEYFDVQFMSKNGSYVYAVPIKTGKTKVEATLSAIEVGDTIMEIEPPLRATEDVDIFDPLSVTPPRTVLPWDPLTKPTYTVNLTAVGGSGALSWSSSNSEVVTVASNGVCKTRARGSVSVAAVMMLNPHNKDSAQIHVIEALGLNLLEGVVEMEVDTPLPLHVASHTSMDKVKVPFTVCHQLPFKVEPSEPTFRALPDVKLPSKEGSCCAVEVVGKSPGFSKVQVTYESTAGPLTASRDVAAFRPLRPINPAGGETVLALGSSRIVLFQGGPLPWIAKPTTHFAKAVIDDEEKVEVKLVDGVTQSDLHAVSVHCHALGEFVLTLTVGNKPSQTLKHPRVVEATLKVICAVPDAISLRAMIKRPVHAHTPCPAMAEIGVALAHCYKPLTMEVVVTDSENRKLDNISSLALSWAVSDTSLANIPQDPTSLIHTQTIHGFALPMFSHQILKPEGQTGEVLVTVKLNGFAKFVSAAIKQLSFPDLSATLPVRLVQDAVITPPSAVLYQHSENSLELAISGGSGFFEIHEPETEVVSLVYQEKTKHILVRPLSDGEAEVTLTDACLETQTPPASRIRVASIASLELLMVEHVELGGSLEAEVIARDAEGHLMPVHTLMNLTLDPQANIISTRYSGINDKGNAVYVVYGKHIGDTSLRASAGTGPQGDAVVHSPPRPVQVFPPLTAHPRNITLIVGAQYQVETKGGPYPDATVVFNMVNASIANTSHTGVVTGLALGTTTLTAQAVTTARDNGATLVYSQDTVIINVVPLTRIRIHAPLTRLETGSSMPLYAVGDEEEQNPLSYATALPPLIFEWSINNKQVATFNGLFSKNGIVEGPENGGVVSLGAEQPGRVTVTLKVRPLVPATLPHYQLMDDALLTDKLEIKVFETLQLKNPSKGSADLLLTPNSHTKIITNRDGSGRLSYAVEGCGGGVVSVSGEGDVHAGPATGQATVIVTVEENFGVTQSIAVLVEVKKVHYMQAKVSAFMNTLPRDSLSVVPVGADLALHLTCHDNRGRAFHATSVLPAFRPSRFDLVDVKHGANNDTLLLKVRGSGQTVLHFWSAEDESIGGFVRIPSGPGINPHKAVIPLGGEVCFGSRVVSVGDGVGEWAAKGEVVQLDAVSGVAVAQHIGRATVAYRVGPALTATTDLTVTPISKVSLSPIDGIRNAEGSEPGLVMVKLDGEGVAASDASCSAGTIQIVPPFTCVVALSPPLPGVDTKDVFSARAVHLPGKGYACEIVSTGKSPSTLATCDSDVILEAVVVGRGQQGEVRSGQLAIPLYPAPHADATQLTLTAEQPSATLAIHGTKDVLAALQVGGGAGDLDVSLSRVEAQQVALTVGLKASLWSSEVPEARTLTITLDSPLTKSTVQISVEVAGGDGWCAVPSGDLGIISVVLAYIPRHEQTLVSIACLVLTVACIVVGYQALVGPGYKQTQQPGVFANSPAAPPPFSPNRTSPGAGVGSGGDSLSKRLNYSPSPPRLWSVSSEPIYGAPPMRRPAYEDSPTYRTMPK